MTFLQLVFFLLLFFDEILQDLDEVLKRGPWFVGQRFLRVSGNPNSKLLRQHAHLFLSRLGCLSFLLSSMILSCLRMWGVPLVQCFILMLTLLMVQEVALQEFVSRLTLINP